jgi:hypothetical protein
MMRMLGLMMVAALVAGCPMRAGTPDDPAVLAAGDAAIMCAVFAVDGDADDVATARRALAAAQTVLTADLPTLTQLAAALAVADNPKWQPVATHIVERVRVRLGGADPIPRDATAFRVAEAFVTACRTALGA